MKTNLLSWWRNHATKFLGVGATFFGGVETLLAVKADSFKLILGERGYAVALVGIGFCTLVVGPVIIKRGFTNTAVWPIESISGPKPTEPPT